MYVKWKKEVRKSMLLQETWLVCVVIYAVKQTALLQWNVAWCTENIPLMN
jgi:hypothetical protein